jgi:hypothetical protein
MNEEQYAKLGEARLVTGDLFSYENIVIPVKTGGRWYGSISREAVRRGIPFPHVVLCEAKHVKHEGKNYVFLGLWDDEVRYSDLHIYRCASSAVLEGAHGHLQQLAMPLLGGNEGHKYIGAMERAIDDVVDLLDPTGLLVPEIVFVTR